MQAPQKSCARVAEMNTIRSLALRFFRKPETAAEIGIRRQEFIRAMRVHTPQSKERLGELVETASVADLEWVIEKIDDKLRSVPLHMKEGEDRDRTIKESIHDKSWMGACSKIRKRSKIETRETFEG